MMDTEEGPTKTEKKYINKDYKDDLNLSTELNRWVLQTIGIWPKSPDHSLFETLKCRFLNLLNILLLAFILVPGIAYIIIEIRNFYNQSVMKVCSWLSFFVMVILKGGMLILREKDIQKCVQFIEADWRNVKHIDDREIMLENARFGRKLISICAAFMYGGLVFYYVILPLTRPKIVDLEDGNLTFKPLAYAVPKYIVDTRHSPINEIVYTIQLMSGLVAHNITVAACGLAALLATHACGQLQVLMAWLENLVDGRADVNDTLDERVANAVEQHIRVINFIQFTEKLLHEIALVELVGCTINMCFLGYYAMTEWDFKQPVNGLTYVLLLISVTFNIFIFCYIGERLADQTVMIGEKSYMIDWYRIPGKKSLAITLMISMSNSTTKMTAGNLFELSIRSFGDVVKTSVTYLNMLRTFTIANS